MKVTKSNPNSESEVMILEYDEELACARKFCKMLDMLWIEDRPSIFKPLCKMFFTKSMGRSFFVKDFVELDGAIQDFNESVKDSEYAHLYLLPDLFADMDFRGEVKQAFTVAPVHAQEGETHDSRINREYREISRAWKEAWEERPKGYLRERYPDFPGDSILNPQETPDKRQKKDHAQEEEFWAMVDQKQEFFGCSRHQAILEVQDYTPRALFTENQLPDPNPKRVVKPVIEMDEWNEDRQNEIDAQSQYEE